MKNGNMPAAPTIYADMGHNGQREIFCDNQGLTKREHFAGLAPQMPDWFEKVFQFEQFKSPLTDEEWQITSVYKQEEYDHDEFERAAELNKLHADAITDYQQKKQISMYFAWRAFYADALLAELEKSE
jgi:hypothetical protein